MKLKFHNLKDLKTKKPSELTAYLSQLHTSKATLQHDLRTNKDKQTHQLKQIRQAVAQTYTILSQQTVTTKEEK